ncbi:MAG: hypothetical protein RIQ33_86, partial [Bacteroidota bacterium]
SIISDSEVNYNQAQYVSKAIY